MLKKLSFILIIALLISLTGCKSNKAISNIEEYIKHFYINESDFGKYQDFTIDSINILPTDDVDSFDSNIALRESMMNILSGSDYIWLGYIEKNNTQLVKTTFSYTSMEGLKTHIQYSFVNNVSNSGYEIIEQTVPQIAT